MKQIVLIGQSTAFLPLCHTLLKNSQEWGLTIISCDGHLPYDQTSLSQLISKKIREKDLFPADAEYFQKNNIQVILDASITRINLKRKRIFFDDKKTLDFDGIVFADTPQIKLPDYKGARREGVFHLARLETVKSLIRFLPSTESILIEGKDWPCLQTALILKEAGKDVCIACGTDRILPQCYSEEESMETQKRLEARGIQVFLQQNIESILGEVDVKAVRLTSGKIIAAEMVLLADWQPDFRFLSDTDLTFQEGRLCVDSSLKTQVEEAYAMDQAFQLTEPFLQGSYTLSKDLRHQLGVRVAQSLCDIPLEPLSWVPEIIPVIEDIPTKEGALYES